MKAPVTGLLLVATMLAGCGDQAGVPARVAGLRVSTLLGDSDLTGFARADVIRSFRFPEDHGPHPRFRSEWWYLTLMLEADHGEAGGPSTGASGGGADGSGARDEYGVQFTLFRQALWAEPVSANPWQSNQAYLGHFAVTDVAADQHVEFERMARGHPRLAGVRASPFALWIDGWRLAESADGSWQLEVSTAQVSLAVSLEPEKPVVLQGERGLSRKGPDQASYYYSLPRLAVAGVLVSDGVSRTVRGSGWLDREWSTSVLGAGQVGWDWFALQLDDGTDLTAFQLRRDDGRRDRFDQALLIDSDGATQTFDAASFQLEVLDGWTDERGVRWPTSWLISLDGRSWRVVAAVRDQRMDTSIEYWEGLVHVYDQPGKRIGRGYMELTGYADE